MIGYLFVVNTTGCRRLCCWIAPYLTYYQFRSTVCCCPVRRHWKRHVGFDSLSLSLSTLSFSLFQFRGRSGSLCSSKILEFWYLCYVVLREMIGLSVDFGFVFYRFSLIWCFDPVCLSRRFGDARILLFLTDLFEFERFCLVLQFGLCRIIAVGDFLVLFCFVSFLC